MASLHEKLLEIMREDGYLQKDGRNDFHKYNYVSERKVSEVLREKLSSRGVLFLTSVEAHGRTDLLTTVRTRHQFIDVESGETLEFWSAGEGFDKGDKGVYKAITGSTKYALMKFFLIPTGDDPEGDLQTDKHTHHEEVEKVARAERALAAHPQSEEDPFGDGEIPAYAEARPIVARMSGRRGVKELRQFFGHCAAKQIAWADVVAFATEQGFDLFGELSMVACTKLRDMIKGGV